MPLLAACVFLLPAPAAASTSSGYRDNTLLPAALRAPHHQSVTSAVVGGTSDAALHMLLALAIVVALIFALYKVLRRTAAKNDRTVRDDGWMRVISSTPLGPSRSLHLVRVGDETLLMAASEHNLTAVRVYSAQEAAHLRLELDQDDDRHAASLASGLLDALKRMTAR